MSNKKPIDQSRILDEMMEMARALQGHALISRQDMPCRLEGNTTS